MIYTAVLFLSIDNVSCAMNGILVTFIVFSRFLISTSLGIVELTWKFRSKSCKPLGYFPLYLAILNLLWGKRVNIFIIRDGRPMAPISLFSASRLPPIVENWQQFFSHFSGGKLKNCNRNMTLKKGPKLHLWCIYE